MVGAARAACSGRAAATARSTRTPASNATTAIAATATAATSAAGASASQPEVEARRGPSALRACSPAGPVCPLGCPGTLRGGVVGVKSAPMSAQLLSGAPVAEAVSASVRERASRLVARGVAPTLAIVLVGDSEDSAGYVLKKHE